MRRNVIYTDQLMRPIAHFSHAVRTGSIIQIGATAGTDAALTLAGAKAGYVDVAAQTERMLDNLENVLGMLGGKLADVVKMKTYVTDVRDIAPVRRICETRVAAVHAFVGSHFFPLPQAAVELDAIAVVDAERKPIDCALPGCTALLSAERFYATFFHGDPATALDGVLAALTRAGLQKADVVQLHVTVSHVAAIPPLEKLIKQVFGDQPIALSILAAALPDPQVSVQIEAFARKGGGAWLASKEKPSAARAVIAGDEIYFGATVGRDRSHAPLAGAQAQIDGAWRSIAALLEQNGYAPENVLRTNNVLTEWRDYVAFNNGYGKNVTRPYPPRTTVQATLSDPTLRAQIEGIAYCGKEDATFVDVKPLS